MTTIVEEHLKAALFHYVELYNAMGREAFIDPEEADIGEPTTLFALEKKEPILNRYPIRLDKESGYFDVSINSLLPEPLFSIMPYSEWDDESITSSIENKAKKLNLEYDDNYFVIYDFPNIGMMFVKDGVEVSLIDAYSLEIIPENSPRSNNKRRISYLNTLSSSYDENTSQKRMRKWLKLSKSPKKIKKWRMSGKLQKSIKKFLGKIKLRPQRDAMWCFPASAQMVIDYFGSEVQSRTQLSNQSIVAKNFGQTRNDAMAVEEFCNIIDGFNKYDDDFEVKILKSKNAYGIDCIKKGKKFWENTIIRQINLGMPVIMINGNHAFVILGYNSHQVFDKVISRGIWVNDPAPRFNGNCGWMNFNNIRKIHYFVEVNIGSRRETFNYPPVCRR